MKISTYRAEIWSIVFGWWRIHVTFFSVFFWKTQLDCAVLVLYEEIYYRERLHIRRQWQQVVALEINVLSTCHLGFSG